jgi:hypothetical protein
MTNKYLPIATILTLLTILKETPREYVDAKDSRDFAQV